ALAVAVALAVAFAVALAVAFAVALAVAFAVALAVAFAVALLGCHPVGICGCLCLCPCVILFHQIPRSVRLAEKSAVAFVLGCGCRCSLHLVKPGFSPASDRGPRGPYRSAEGRSKARRAKRSK